MSRLECKVIDCTSLSLANSIRICPDWNVKVMIVVVDQTRHRIRICPDWNVKFAQPHFFLFLFRLEYVQIGM